MKNKIIILPILFLLTTNFSCIESGSKELKPETPHLKRSEKKSDLIHEQNLSNSKHTVKTQPDGSDYVLKPKSPFFKTYSTWRAKLSLDNEAWDKAFKFLDENYKSLDSKQVCLASDNKNNRKKIRNLNCMIIADYTKDKMQKRLYVIELKKNKVHQFYTAHGKGSNEIKEKSLMATKFSNTPGSLQTSLGFYLSAEPYNSYKDTFGPRPNNGIKLDGISCTNNNARKRYIVLHTAKYVPKKVTTTQSIGYSEGCITISPQYKELVHKCMHGALIYAYGKNAKKKSTQSK